MNTSKPFIEFKHFLSNDEINLLLKYWYSINTINRINHNNWNTKDIVINEINASKRKVSITGLPKDSISIITSKITSLFNFILGSKSSIEAPHYLTKYDIGDFHGPHKDKLSGMWYRDRVMTIQLSDSSDYEGGDLKIGESIAPRTKGSAIIYRGDLIHEVTKITKGTRFSLTECAGIKPAASII